MAAAKRVGAPPPAFYEELRSNLATNLRAARIAAELTTDCGFWPGLIAMGIMLNIQYQNGVRPSRR